MRQLETYHLKGVNPSDRRRLVNALIRPISDIFTTCITRRDASPGLPR